MIQLTILRLSFMSDRSWSILSWKLMSTCLAAATRSRS
jgi:hypothetical protein